MDLIKVENNVAFLDNKTSQQIAEFEKTIKDLQEKEKALKEAILTEMRAKNIIKIETPELYITYVAETMREDFKKDDFRAEHPDLYDDFIKMTPVKASIRLKVK